MEIETRQCWKCLEIKDINRFKPTPIGRRWACRTCVNKQRDPKKVLACARRWEASLLAYRRVFERYGITQEQYVELMISQGNVCAICQKPPSKRRLAVDHIHGTKIIRGLLCTNCNSMLGRFSDDVNTFFRVIKYIQNGLKLMEGKSNAETERYPIFATKTDRQSD